MALPRLRPLEAFPVRVDGRTMICVRDHEGLVEEPVFLTPETFLVASMLDGRADVLDIQTAFARRSGGSLLMSGDIRRLVEDLDRAGLLETEGLAQRRQALAEAFAALPARPAYHAGRAYPDDPAALAAALDRYFAAVEAGELAGLAPRGVVAPHIDYARGGWCYAWAHAALAAAAPETVLILGVAHRPARSPFVLTTKPYESPLGVLPVDEDLAARLAALDGLLADEVAHRTEHAVEFQVPFLLRAAAGRPVRAVTVLCAALEPWAGDGSPRGLPAVERFVEVIRQYLTGGRRTAVLASVDFSHVGPRFGDREPADRALAVRTSARDHEVLEALAAGDAEAFWRVAMEDGNRQRIDAVSAVYVALRILAPTQGRLLRYGQAPDPAGGLVSFASVAFV